MTDRGATWNFRHRVARTSLLGAACACMLVAGTCAASVFTEVLKTMPANGSVRQGDVVYVDDGRCPRGEVKKVTGGNQNTGLARQVECVKRPGAGAER